MKIQEAYKALDLAEGSKEQEIKKAFRKKAAELHPDKNPNNPKAEEEFKKINEAYRILMGTQQPDPEYQNTYANPAYTNNVNINDIFSTIFGKRPFGGVDFGNMNVNFDDGINGTRARSARQQAIGHIYVAKQIDFETSLKGGKTIINIKRRVYCKECEGEGRIGDKNQCPTCLGEGAVHKVNRGINYSQIFTTTCETCDGEGKIGTKCNSCKGAGYTTEDEDIKVNNIPATGSHAVDLILRGKGNVYFIDKKEIITDVYLHVTPTTINGKFSIAGYDVLSEEKIPLNILLFGGDFDIESPICGKHTIKIDKNCRAGNQVFIQNLGAQTEKTASKHNGRHIVTLQIEYPKVLSDELKTALENSYKEDSNGKT